MNTTLKPVLTTSGPQSAQVAAQLNKPMHPQGGAPATYGQPPSSHMPQNLVNLPHNTNAAHTHPNASQNHYSLNVPNNSSYNSGIPASNHPVANVPSSATAGQVYNAPKAPPFSGGYQPNLGHPPNVSTDDLNFFCCKVNNQYLKLCVLVISAQVDKSLNIFCNFKEPSIDCNFCFRKYKCLDHS